MRARRARLTQDSTLTAYDAMAHERLTIGLGIGGHGPERLLLRAENAARVRWQRGHGAVVDVVGARDAFPMMAPGVRVSADMLHIDAIPYYPGRENLLRLVGVNSVGQRDENLFINPLVDGAEAYYRFRTGDSVTFALPDGSHARLREVRVEARQPRSDLIVGSLWFDVASAQLVRAVYRPSMPFDIVKYVESTEEDAFEDVPKLVKPMIFPMELTITAYTVEYGLHEQRWWLPRVEAMEGRMRVGLFRSPFSVEQSYRYASVNGTDTLPPIFSSAKDSAASEEPDSTRRMRADARDSARTAARARRRSGARGKSGGDSGSLNCAAGDTLTRRAVRYGGALPMLVRIPCDTVALTHSPEFSPSIYDSGELLFGAKERADLEKELTMGLQPAWHPLPPMFHYGLDRGMLRYNRVEGLSAGGLVESTLGRGYIADASARIGIADWQPNIEAHLRRGDGARNYGLGVYRRLDSANDWGDPLSVGSSISALLWSRDEGFYFRSWGAELTAGSVREGMIGWRLFAERQGDTERHTNFSIRHLSGGSGFVPNIRAADATVFGLGASYHDSYGLDPKRLRATLEARAEGGVGTFDYARAAAEGTVTRSLGARLDGALTASVGSSAGTVPVQRFWFLGGVETVRGQEPGTDAGNAYWLARAEVGHSFVGVRPTIFFDAGWAGDRRDWDHPGRPISGAGAGFSVLDGLVRLDLAHGISPNHALRVDLYTQARF